MGFQDVNDTARAQGPEGVRNRSDRARPIGNGGGRGEAPPAPATLAAVNAAFRKWLVLKDLTPVHAVLGAVAANLLPGDPVWLGVIAPPSTAKTEILNALARIPHVEAVATLSMAALLSGTPKGQKAAGSKGGLLRKIGGFGVLVLKDFGSILSMQRDGQAETLAALREIYDGSWTRHVGSDGGKTLHWQGKLGLVFGATEAFDDRHAVISSLGDRFLTCRLNPASGRQQLKAAFDHTGATTNTMRTELAEAVAGLFAVAATKAPRPLAETERERLGDAVKLAVRLRAHVNRDAPFAGDREHSRRGRPGPHRPLSRAPARRPRRHRSRPRCSANPGPDGRQAFLSADPREGFRPTERRAANDPRDRRRAPPADHDHAPNSRGLAGAGPRRTRARQGRGRRGRRAALTNGAWAQNGRICRKMTKRLFLLERAVPAIQEGHEGKNPESFSLSLLTEFRERVVPARRRPLDSRRSGRAR
jgi:hypothetical protein